MKNHCCRQWRETSCTETLYNHCSLDTWVCNSPIIFKNFLSFVLQIFLQLKAFESNATSDWLNHMAWLIRNFCYIQIYSTLEKKTNNVLENGWCIQTLGSLLRTTRSTKIFQWVADKIDSAAWIFLWTMFVWDSNQ